MEWIRKKIKDIENRNRNVSIETYKKKWRPLLESKRYEFKLDNDIFEKSISFLSEFIDIYVEIDGNRPEISPFATLRPSLYEPEGWIEREDVINMFFHNLKIYENLNKEINLEIEKTYYNIVTDKVTYLLKTEDGLKMDFEVKKELNKKVREDIDDILLDTKTYILYPEKRSQLERKIKIKSLLNT